MNSRKGLRLASIFVSTLLVACHSGSDATPVPNIWNLYNGDRAFADVKAQVDLGPRPAGSAQLDKARQYIVDQMQRAGWNIERQEFDDQTPRGTVHFCNL